jgi:hypothetical protein
LIVLVALTVGLVLWIVGWALGIKPFDAFMVTALLVVTAAAIRIAQPYIRERLRP